ncbi:MAG: sugar transferase, partial [Candidatus Marinimicrobia bacterium]|nr:sugar transferase [Candidatus Neomarinimicrobiota bacterium]
GRLLLISILKNNDLLGFKKRPTLIIGASNRAINVATKIKNVPVLKFNLVGYIDDHANGNVGKIIQGIPILGGFEDIPTFIKQKKIKEAIIALDDSDSDTIMDLIAIFSHYNVSVKLLPDFYNLVSGFKTSHIYGVSLIRFFSSNMKTWEWLLKRIIDIAVSLMVLIVFMPIWVIIALAILIDSSGPIFYKQKRIGKNKQEFELIKFRSMMHNAEDLTGPKWAEKEDSRITRLGQLLRKTGLDEIPQFFNVLMGDMSIVGPRPERLYFVNELEQSIQFYSRRLIVKPGITGWAQIKYKYDESIDDVREKLRYDLYYIENMSILLDLKIIVQTLLVGIRKKHRAAYN